MQRKITIERMGRCVVFLGAGVVEVGRKTVQILVINQKSPLSIFVENC